MRPRAAVGAGALAILVTARASAEPGPAPAEARIAPAVNGGGLGAWLVAGPFRASKPALEVAPPGVDEKAMQAALGALLGGERDLAGRRPPARWTIGAVTNDEPRRIDLRALEDATGSELIAYAAGRLHVAAAGKYVLLLGVDDGVRVSVDGAAVYTRDAARPLRDDDDVVPLDLGAGDHDIVLKLHQRSGAWAFRARFVDRALATPAGAWLALPGTTADDARALAVRLASIGLDRGFVGERARYEPSLAIRYSEGAPRGVPLSVAVKGPGFDLHAGAISFTVSGAGELVVALPSPTGAGTIETMIGGLPASRTTFTPRPSLEQAIAHVERALAAPHGDEPWLLPGSIDSVRHLSRRAARLLARGDTDLEAQVDEAQELDALAANLDRGADPYDGRSGMMRRAILTPLDGGPTELGLYVPPSYRPGDGRRWPLVVGLHGLNSYPMSLMRALFGLDDAQKDAAWKDRHRVPLPPLDAFVITPYAHGNTMYREIGEDDVLFTLDWAKRTFPIDASRISVTGPSMGGIGAASLPFHFPNLFHAAEPLCGYHSYLIRSDIVGRGLRPWERSGLEERSNVLWAENGEHLPLYIVHGTRDLPEQNSGVLIERYEKLGYAVKHEHPDAGHNVWGVTYESLKGLKWLLSQPKLDPRPAHVRFRTMRARYATSAWVTLDELAGETGWAEVDARLRSRAEIVATTSGVAAITFARAPDGPGTVRVVIDGTSLVYDDAEPLVVHREATTWVKGAANHGTPVKRGHVTGPIRDVFHEPVTFVWASDPVEARATERVARGFADRPGIPTAYPVMSDLDFFARNESLANDRALFLVGRTNRVLAALGAFPIRVDNDAVTVGADRIAGTDLGAAFIHPNPLRPDRYVVVVAASDALATLRALSLPDVLPDFLVWDAAIVSARGQVVLGSTPIRAGGIFRNDWSLPKPSRPTTP